MFISPSTRELNPWQQAARSSSLSSWFETFSAHRKEKSTHIYTILGCSWTVHFMSKNSCIVQGPLLSVRFTVSPTGGIKAHANVWLGCNAKCTQWSEGNEGVVDQSKPYNSKTVPVSPFLTGAVTFLQKTPRKSRCLSSVGAQLLPASVRRLFNHISRGAWTHRHPVLNQSHYNTLIYILLKTHVWYGSLESNSDMSECLWGFVFLIIIISEDGNRSHWWHTI